MRKTHGFIFGLALSASLAFAAKESVDHAFSVSAPPLQAYQAMVVDWQLIQWNGGTAVASDVRPGGFWRVTYPDGHIEEGLIVTAIPAQQLTYTQFIDGVPTEVNVLFLRTNTGTEIRLKHANFGEGSASVDRHDRAAAMWDARLPMLVDYLNSTPSGYMARPSGIGPFPGVLLLHDQFGLNSSVRVLADSLARAGYFTLAVDMFSNGATAEVVMASQSATVVNGNDAVGAALSGMNALRSNPNVLTRRIAVMGMGLGANMALEVAAAEPRTTACVLWYPEVLPNEDLYRRITCPVLAIFGASDVGDPRASVETFSKALVQAGVRAETMTVLAAPRFADPSYGADYNPAAAAQAWQRSVTFLDTRLRR